MAGPSPISGEVSNSKVAAIFPSQAAAQSAASAVRQSLGLTGSQVELLAPGDPAPGRHLEPESHGIFRTMLIAHARLGIVGAVVGAIAFAALYATGSRMIVSSSLAAFLVLVVSGAVAGLFVGGLVTLRPDHDRYILAVLSALKEGRSAVLVHAFSSEQRNRAEQALKEQGGETVATL